MSAADRIPSLPAGRHQRLPHRPALDGLRGVAVAAVVAYHLRPSALPGGFIGVDVFFVLSGFLITSLLLVEAEISGAVRLGRFVVRRVRRLAPAMLLLVAAMAVYGATWANPFELQRLRTHGVWTLLSLANWRFITEGVTYTDVVVGSSPLRHMWSLSIEEQFYAVLPLAVFVLSRVSVPRLRRTVLWGALVIGAASVTTAAWLSLDGASTGRTYFGTDTRAQALLVGVALGALLSGRPVANSRRRPAAVGALAGMGMLVAFALTVHERSSLLPRGGFLIVALASALVVAGAEHLPPLHRVLTARWLTGLGAISYGVYLWHWPIIVVIDARRTGLRAGSPSLVALQLALTLVIAMASYWLVELPIRSGVLGRRLGRVGAALVWPVVTTTVVVALVLATVPPTLAVSQPTGSTAGSTMASTPTGTDVPGAQSVRMVMFGDSVAHSLAGGEVLDFPNVAPWKLEQATEPDLLSLARPGCSFLPGTVTVDQGATEADLSQFCGDWRADLAAGLTEHRATHLVVLLVNDMADRVVDGKLVRFGSPQFVGLLDALLDELRTIAAAHGAQLVLLAPASRLPQFTDPVGERAPAMLQLLADYADRHGLLALSLADAPTTDRFDGTHYGWTQAHDVLTWVTEQITSRPVATPSTDG